MNAEQKRALVAVAACSACVIGFLILLPMHGPWVALGAFGFYGITGFTAFIGRREPTDERDHDIARRATLAGAMMSYMAFILGCMGTWTVAFELRGRDLVSVHVLSLITATGGIVFFSARSVAILVLYGRVREADHA